MTVMCGVLCVVDLDGIGIVMGVVVSIGFGIVCLVSCVCGVCGVCVVLCLVL